MKYCRTYTRIKVMIATVVLTFLARQSIAQSDNTNAIDVTRLPAAASVAVDFAKDIRPILAGSCYSCHGPEKQEGGLRLDLRASALTGGDSGHVILPGKGAESRLLQLVAGLDEEAGRMPPADEGAALSAEQVALVRAWIDAGAQWPDELAGDPAGPASMHWSFAAISRPELPEVRDRAWVRNPIDTFVLAKLEHENVRPSPQADRLTLLRRVYLDLIGLPPSIAEIDAFLANRQPDAYEHCVDQLLESPHYGERWGRHWLDLARYADTDGYEQDLGRPFAWRYRDWVINAFNRDLAFDKFTVQQLAGDLLTADDPEFDASAKVATGFHRNTLINKEAGVDPEEDRVKRTIDRTNTLGTVWLGLTVGCANCHSHKYDPISQREYFGLYAFFNSLDELDVPTQPDSPDSLAQTISRRAALRETCVHLRGDFLSKGPTVVAHAPAILPPLYARSEIPDRLDLARWLIADTHPLTARIVVNRQFKQVFGRGLVATDEDFGKQGELPSHPQLLDWLACELRDHGWSLKHVLRLLVNSSTYRQSSTARPELLDRDPYNTWLARQNRLRVEAEIVRDLALSASGLLNASVGGPSVRPPQPEGISELTYSNFAKWVSNEGADRYRRGLYTWFQRTSPFPALIVFDAPEANLTCTRRERSNTPLQALTLLNDITFVEFSQALGRRMMAEVTAPVNAELPTDVVEARIRFAFRLCMAREPSKSDLNTLVALFAEARSLARKDLAAAAQLIGSTPTAEADVPENAASVVVARALLNLDEFINRE